MDQLNKELMQVVEELFNLSEAEHEQINQLYKQSEQNIKDFVARLYMEYGNEGKIEPHEAKRLNRMENLFEQIKQDAERVAQEQTIIVAGILGTVFAAAYYKSAYQMESFFQMGINYNIQRQEMIDEVVNRNWSGVPFSERIWDNQNALVKSLRTQLMQGVEEGKTVDQMARSIGKEFDSKYYQSQRLMVTESARVVSDAQETVYRDSEIVKQVEWSATLESNTCSECASLDGQRFQLGNETKPKIPRHPNCKCVFLPVPFVDYQPSKRKDNETNEIIEYQTYQEWYEAKIT